MSEADTTTDVLILKPWPDPLVETHGLDPHGPRFSAVWTPILGPAAAAAFRALHLAALGDTDGGEPPGHPVELPVLTLGSALGLSARKAPLVVRTALDRLCRHSLVSRSDGEVAVRTSAPPPTRRQSSRIPRAWRDFLVSRSPSTGEARVAPTPGAPCGASPRVRQLALRLVRTGQSTEAVRQRLRMLGEQDDAIESALAWAAPGPGSGPRAPDLPQSPPRS